MASRKRFHIASAILWVNKILVNGGTLEDAATILGDSPDIIRKHYNKWSVETQARTVEVLRRVHGTIVAHEKISP